VLFGQTGIAVTRCRSLVLRYRRKLHGTENKIAICLLDKLVRIEIFISMYVKIVQIGAANGRDTSFVRKRFIRANLKIRIKFLTQFIGNRGAVISRNEAFCFRWQTDIFYYLFCNVHAISIQI